MGLYGWGTTGKVYECMSVAVQEDTEMECTVLVYKFPSSQRDRIPYILYILVYLAYVKSIS